MRIVSPALTAFTLMGSLLLAALATPARAQNGEVDPIIDWPFILHFRDRPRPQEFQPKLVPLWKSALQQPDALTRLQTVEAIREAHDLGMKGLESFDQQLEIMVDESGQQTPLYLALGKLLVALDDKSAAPRLLELSNTIGADMIVVADPGLARWRYPAAIEACLKRLSDPAAPVSLQISAVEALGVAGDAKAVPELSRIVLDGNLTPPLRLAAARVLGGLHPLGLDDTARMLMDRAGPGAVGAEAAFSRILAANVLSGGSSHEAQGLLLQLARDSEPSVATIALTRLVSWEPDAVLPLTPELLKNPDANVRRLGAEALLAHPTPESITAVFPLLGDLVPSLRTWLCGRVVALAPDPTLGPAIRQQTLEALGGTSWRSLEQALFVAGKTGLKEAAPIIVERKLTDHPRGEVALAAIVALRWLDVPETYPAVMALAPVIQKRNDKNMVDLVAQSRAHQAGRPAPFKGNPRDFVPASRRSELLDDQMSQVFTAMGRWQYQPADAMLRAWLPKSAAKFGMATARLAAFWAIGRIHAGKPDAALVKLLTERAEDVSPFNSEPDPIRLAAVAAMADMGARDALLAMKKKFPMNAGWVDWVLNPNAPYEPPDPVYITTGTLVPLPTQP